MRLRDAQDLDPQIAVRAIVEGRDLVALLVAEGRLQEVLLVGQVLELLAVGRLAGTVDRVDDDRLEALLPGSLLKRRAAGARILIGVLDIVDPVVGLLEGQLLLDVLLDLAEGLDREAA